MKNYCFTENEGIYNKNLQLGKGLVYRILQNGSNYLQIEVEEEFWNPFQEAILWNHFLLIGCGEQVYVIELDRCEVRIIPVKMYFGYFQQVEDKLLILSGMCVYCLGKNCQMIWTSDDIAVDGITFTKCTNQIIEISCEMDPPGGWIDRKISFIDGKEIIE